MSVRKVLFLTLLINTAFILIGLLIGRPPEQYFSKEASYITWVSFFQLLLVAFFSLQVFKIRKGNNNYFWKNPSFLWLIIAIGFLFLSIDEVIRIHENLDRIIHKSFHMKETALSDRIDDALVGLYALIGIGTLYFYKSELNKYRSVIVFFIVGFSLIFLMVFSEMIVNRNDVLPLIFSNKFVVNSLYSMFKVLEESFKLFAEAILITSMYYCLQVAKQLQEN